MTACSPRLRRFAQLFEQPLALRRPGDDVERKLDFPSQPVSQLDALAQLLAVQFAPGPAAAPALQSRINRIRAGRERLCRRVQTAGRSEQDGLPLRPPILAACE